MKARLNKKYLPLALSTLLLLPTANSLAREITMVSIDSTGAQGNGYTLGNVSISANGRYVVFESYASNLVSEDANVTQDIFVHDRLLGATSLVSLASSGEQGNDYSSTSAISADGRFVTFASHASNLVADDTNALADIFVRDLVAGTTTRVSIGSNGEQSNSSNSYPSISSNGRFIAFVSLADNLVTGDTNGREDIFVHDLLTGTTKRISIDSAGNQANSASYAPVISADGRFVAFQSEAANLVEGDTNAESDIFVHDQSTGETTRISVDSAATQGNEFSAQPAISANGRFVAFFSGASNLVDQDTNGYPDVFVKDRTTGKTTRVSIGSTGEQGNNSSAFPNISADGRFVAFSSYASSLAPRDTKDFDDSFIHDRTTGQTTRISVTSEKKQGNNSSYYPAINADGRFVVFTSMASNLVTGDVNGWPDIFVYDHQLNTAKTADLQLTVTRQPKAVQTGQPARYVYTISNNGPDSIRAEVQLTDTIANGKPLQLTPSQGVCKQAAVSICRFGALATGESITLTTTIKASGNPLTQQLSVNAPPVDNAPDNNSITVATPVTP
ncbi:MAG: hypothetical protein ACXWT3_04200 [Methylococcaceae bacterium]